MPADLHYYRVPEHWTREEKLEFLRTHSLYPASPAQEAAAAEEAAHRLDVPRPYPVCRPSKHLRAAAEDFQRASQVLEAMSRANPGHAALPALEKRLAETRGMLFAALRHQDRHDRRAFLFKWGV